MTEIGVFGRRVYASHACYLGIHLYGKGRRCQAYLNRYSVFGFFGSLVAYITYTRPRHYSVSLSYNLSRTLITPEITALSQSCTRRASVSDIFYYQSSLWIFPTSCELAFPNAYGGRARHCASESPLRIKC